MTERCREKEAALPRYLCERLCVLCNVTSHSRIVQFTKANLGLSKI